MKKGLVGCLLVGVVVIAVGAGLAWWFVLKPMVGPVSTAVESTRQWASAMDAEKAIRNQSAFTPPADGRLTQEQVNRFVAVQSNLEMKLGADFETLRREHEKMQAEQAAAGQAPDVRDAVGAYARLGELLAKAREAQVEGMNRGNLSLAEYRWIRDRAYAALPFLDMDPDAIVAPKPPPGAAVDAATGEIIPIPDAPPEPLETVDPVDAMAADAAAVATDAADEPASDDSGLEYAGTAPEEIESTLPDSGLPTTLPPKPTRNDDLAETVQDRGLGDDRALDPPDVQAARANAVLLRPHKDLLLRTLGASWVGL